MVFKFFMYCNPAQAKRFAAGFLLFLFVLSFSLALPSSASAAFRQRDYYDWGVSSRSKPSVLGLAAFAQETATEGIVPPGGLTGDFDPDNPPAGFDPTDLPQGFDLSTLPEGFDPDNPPEGLNPVDYPGGFPADVVDEVAPGGVVPGSTTAQPTSGDSGTAIDPSDITTDIGDGGLLPDSPLYFLESGFEGVQLALTFNPELKAERKLDMAEERLAEASTLIDEGKVNEGTTHLEVYQNQLDDATNDLKALQAEGADVAGLAQKVELAASKHTTVLEDVIAKVPQEVVPAIDNAIEASQTGMDRAADALGEPPIPVDLLARMSALKGQGILTDEEAGALVSAGSREEARNLLKNLVESGVFPEADFKRLDVGQAKFFAQDFVESVEISKFHEMRKLEELGPPDEATLARLEEFAATYTPGDIVPPDLRDHWIGVVRLEEIQKTFRPDVIADDYFVNDQDAFSKFQEFEARVMPTEAEVAAAEAFLQANPDQPLPPEFQRALDLKDNLGVLPSGLTPPPGHFETSGIADLLPETLFKFDIPLQTGLPPGFLGPPSGGDQFSGGTGPVDEFGQPVSGPGASYSPDGSYTGVGGEFDFQKFFQDSNFLGNITPSPGADGTSGGALDFGFYPDLSPTDTFGNTGPVDESGQPLPGPGASYSPDGTYQQPTYDTSGTYQQPVYDSGTTYTQPVYDSGGTATQPVYDSGTTSTYVPPPPADSGGTTTSEPAPAPVEDTAPPPADSGSTTSEPAPQPVQEYSPPPADTAPPPSEPAPEPPPDMVYGASTKRGLVWTIWDFLFAR